MKAEQAIIKLIISSLLNNYGIEVSHIKPLALGADADAVIYKVNSPSQKAYFVKLKQSHHDSSVNLQLILNDAGIQEVICLIKTIDGQSQIRTQDFTLTVYPFIDGQDGFTKNLTNEQWIALGKTLKQIHQLQLPASITQSLKQEDFSSKWINKVKLIYATIEDVIPSDEIASEFIASLKEYQSTILQLTDNVKSLINIITAQPINAVLCHGDIHAGNVLIANDKNLYIVDWDKPIMAPKERDLMFIGAGIGNVWNQKHELDNFYAGYGETKIDQNLINYYRCNRILQDVVEFYEQIITNNINHNNRELSYNHFIAMFEPNGVVDIALKS